MKLISLIQLQLHFKVDLQVKYSFRLFMNSRMLYFMKVKMEVILIKLVNASMLKIPIQNKYLILLLYYFKILTFKSIQASYLKLEFSKAFDMYHRLIIYSVKFYNK